MTSEDRTYSAQNDKVGANTRQSILIFGNADHEYARLSHSQVGTSGRGPASKGRLRRHRSISV